MHAIDLTQYATSVSIHQQLTLPFSSTPQLSAPPNNITEIKHALYPPTPSSLATIIEIRDIQIPQLCPHNIPYNSTLTQMYMQETDHQFQIPALDFTIDHLYSRVTKATTFNGFFV